MSVKEVMGGRKESLLLSLMVICAIFTGCLGEEEEESIEELDGDVLLEWWLFTTNSTSYDFENDYIEEISDGETVLIDYPAPPNNPVEYLLSEIFFYTIQCTDGSFAENGMPIPLDQQDKIALTVRACSGKILYNYDDFPCDGEDYSMSDSDDGGDDGRYWSFSYNYSYNRAYHSADEAFIDLENDNDLPSYESIFPITIEITAQTAGEIPGVSEDKSLEVSLTNMFYTRYDPEAIFWGMYTVDDCESLLGHEH